MEFVKVMFPTSRLVYIDGEPGGRTNTVLRIEAGTHVFELGNLVNYEPVSQEVAVVGTTVLEPLVVTFSKKGS